MIKKQQDFILVILGKYMLVHHFYIIYIIVSFDLYTQSALRYVSKCDLILRTSQFIDVSWKESVDLTIFQNLLIFITVNPSFLKFLNILL